MNESTHKILTKAEIPIVKYFLYQIPRNCGVKEFLEINSRTLLITKISDFHFFVFTKHWGTELYHIDIFLG